MICGYAEILKHSIIKDKKFFNWLKSNTKFVLQKRAKQLSYAIKKSCEIKMYFVNKDVNEKMTWARTGKKIVRKFRCVGGRRHGRIVAKVAQCYAAPDPKKRARLKIMKARLGARLAKKTKRTKRTNPASIRLKQLNKRR